MNETKQGITFNAKAYCIDKVIEYKTSKSPIEGSKTIKGATLVSIETIRASKGSSINTSINILKFFSIM